MTGAPDHKPHTAVACLHWPNLLSVCRSKCQYPQEERIKLYMPHYCFKNVFFFSNSESSEDAIACTICYPETVSGFKQTLCRGENWSDGQQRGSTELLLTPCPDIYLSPQESKAARPDTSLKQLLENLAGLLFYQDLFLEN